MKVSAARRARIIKARDNALAILQRHGTLKDGVLSWKRSAARGLSIAHSTPFSPWRRGSGLSERDKYAAATRGLKAPETLSSQLDIWHDGKVLNIEWDGADLIVVGYKPGVWENMLESIAAESEAA